MTLFMSAWPRVPLWMHVNTPRYVPLVCAQVVPASVTAALKQAMQRHNSLLSAAVRALAAERGPGVTAPRVTYFDLYTSILQVQATHSHIHYQHLLGVFGSSHTWVQEWHTGAARASTYSQVLCNPALVPACACGLHVCVCVCLQIRNTAIGAGSMDVTDSCLNYALLFPVIKTMLTRYVPVIHTS